MRPSFPLGALATAALGNAIDNGLGLRVQEQGGQLAGREIEFVKVDHEGDPSKATDSVNKLIKP